MRILISCICFLVFFACNTRNTSKKILSEFDSINRSLDQVSDQLNSSTIFLYDSLEKKFAGTDKSGSIQQLYYQVNDFYGYLSDLKHRFYIFCGDTLGFRLHQGTEDKTGLTNDFFIKQETAIYLFDQLQLIKSVLTKHASSDSLKERINRIGEMKMDKPSPTSFLKYYFRDTPPVGAITILNSFEADVRFIEARIVNDYLKN